MHIRYYGNIALTSPREDGGGGIHPYHHEILYVSSGEVQLDWQSQIYRTKGPALFFLTPNTPHRLTKLSAHYSFLYMEVELQADPFLNLAEMVRWNAMQDQAPPSYALSVIRQTMDQVREYLESELSADRELIDGLATADMQKVILLARQLLSDRSGPRGAPAGTEDAIESLVRFMESLYRENITLKDLSDLAHLNASYLIRLFKRLKGMTPFQYLNQLRLNAAVNHLRNSELSVQDIVRLTGYGSIHYFSRLFKKTYGISPTLWRRQQREAATVAAVPVPGRSFS